MPLAAESFVAARTCHRCAASICTYVAALSRAAKACWWR